MNRVGHGFGGGLQLAEQTGDIEDQRHLAGAEDGRAADAAQVLEHLAEGLDHGLQFAKQLVDDQPGLLPALADHDYVAAPGTAWCQAEMPVEGDARQGLAPQVEIALALAQPLGAGLHAFGDHVQRDDEIVLADADLEAVDDRQGQRQADAEGAALAGHRVDLDHPAQLVDGTAHHIHADAAAGEVGDLFGGGEPRFENQQVDIRIAELRVRVHQALVDGLGQDPRGVQATAVVADFEDDHAGVVIGIEAQVAFGGLADGQALGSRLDAVVDGVAHQVGQRIGDLVDHRLVQLGLAADQAQLDILVQFLADITDHPMEAIESLADFHHAQFQRRFADLLDVLVHGLGGFHATAVGTAPRLHLRPGGTDHQFADEVDQFVELVRGDLDHRRVEAAAVTAGRGLCRGRIEGRRRLDDGRHHGHGGRLDRTEAELAEVLDKLEDFLDFRLAGGGQQLEFKAQVAGFRVQMIEGRQGLAAGSQGDDCAQALEVAQERRGVEAVAKQLLGKADGNLPGDRVRRPWRGVLRLNRSRLRGRLPLGLEQRREQGRLAGLVGVQQAAVGVDALDHRAQLVHAVEHQRGQGRGQCALAVAHRHQQAFQVVGEVDQWRQREDPGRTLEGMHGAEQAVDRVLVGGAGLKA
ncbi:hypothetical protein PHLH7_02630 [Pseudomonas sp. Ost2]|nr:hypothetical protein PHLH7_02630 [Pseudomonas sp. Ost2]